MPTRRSAAAAKSASPTKTDTASRRKVGTPKKIKASPEHEEAAEEAEVPQEVESTPTRRRGRPKKSVQSSAEVEAPLSEDIDYGEELTDPPESSHKKRKASEKAAAAKKGKSEPSSTVKDIGAGGDGENLLKCTLCDAKVVQLVRHVRAQHGDDPEYDVKIKEARALEAKAQNSTPRKSTAALLDELGTNPVKAEKTPVSGDKSRTPRESSGSLIRPKNTQCPICEKVVRRYDLNKHIRNVHSGEKPNKCPYCDYASPWKGNLNTHIAGVHTKTRLHDCSRCGLSFKTRSAMIGHMRKVHDKMYQPKERLFECEECNKKFYKKFHLQRHIRVHTGEKPFTCAFCEKSFASKTNMDSHIQSVHLKIKPFKCGYCEKGFARKKMMLVHIRKYHMNKEDNDLPLSLQDVDDITIDDNMDDDSDNESLESGEILTGGDDEEGKDMVLVKMKEGPAGDSAAGSVKSYMFVPADDMLSDMDRSLNDSQVMSEAEPTPSKTKGQFVKPAEPAAVTPKAGKVTIVGKPTTTTTPVVISVPTGQVVQALRTSEGNIMLVTQSATVTEHVPIPVSVSMPVHTIPVVNTNSAQQVLVNSLDQPKTKELELEPDLVQQALAATVPEVTAVTQEEQDEIDDAAAVHGALQGAGSLHGDTSLQVEGALHGDGSLQVEAALQGDTSLQVEAALQGDTSLQVNGVLRVDGSSKTLERGDGDLTASLPDNLLATEEADTQESSNGVTDTDFGFLDDIPTNGN